MPVAGWYADPKQDGQLRFWDGERWTIDVRDPPPADPEVVPARPAIAVVERDAPSRPAPSDGGRWRLIAVVGAAAVLVVVLVLVVARSQGPSITRAQQVAYVRAIHADSPALPISVDGPAFAYGRSVCAPGLSPAARATLLDTPVAGMTPPEVRSAWSEALIHLCPQANYSSPSR